MRCRQASATRHRLAEFQIVAPLMALIDELVGKYSKTVLMVTHDPVVAARAHTTLHLEKGVLVEGKTSRESVMAGGAA